VKHVKGSEYFTDKISTVVSNNFKVDIFSRVSHDGSLDVDGLYLFTKRLFHIASLSFFKLSVAPGKMWENKEREIIKKIPKMKPFVSEPEADEWLQWCGERERGREKERERQWYKWHMRGIGFGGRRTKKTKKHNGNRLRTQVRTSRWGDGSTRCCSRGYVHRDVHTSCRDAGSWVCDAPAGVNLHPASMTPETNAMTSIWPPASSHFRSFDSTWSFVHIKTATTRLLFSQMESKRFFFFVFSTLFRFEVFLKSSAAT